MLHTFIKCPYGRTSCTAAPLISLPAPTDASGWSPRAGPSARTGTANRRRPARGHPPKTVAGQGPHSHDLVLLGCGYELRKLRERELAQVGDVNLPLPALRVPEDCHRVHLTQLALGFQTLDALADAARCSRVKLSSSVISRVFMVYGRIEAPPGNMFTVVAKKLPNRER